MLKSWGWMILTMACMLHELHFKSNLGERCDYDHCLTFPAAQEGCGVTFGAQVGTAVGSCSASPTSHPVGCPHLQRCHLLSLPLCCLEVSPLFNTSSGSRKRLAAPLKPPAPSACQLPSHQAVVVRGTAGRCCSPAPAALRWGLPSGRLGLYPCSHCDW